MDFSGFIPNKRLQIINNAGSTGSCKIYFRQIPCTLNHSSSNDNILHNYSEILKIRNRHQYKPQNLFRIHQSKLQCLLTFLLFSCTIHSIREYFYLWNTYILCIMRFRVLQYISKRSTVQKQRQTHNKELSYFI